MLFLRFDYRAKSASIYAALSLAQTTILRWLQRYAPEFVKRWNRFATRA
jgi:hypothetical protein